MQTKTVAHLKKVSLRDVFKNEPRDFSQWLMEPENIKDLGITLGISLQPHKAEVSVGSFRADIVCHDGADQKIVIENQLEKSDHGHLGQLITYAAGLDAKTVVWIAPKINQQHRVTLDWLNQMSPERFRVFGVELELVRILDSPPAAQFTLVNKPLEWREKPRKLPSSTPTQSAQRRREYWKEFLTGLKLKDYTRDLPKENSLGNLRFSLGRGAWITVYASSSITRMGVFLRVPSPLYR